MLPERKAVPYRQIFTIGYEQAAIENLIATLKEAGVSRIIDIRHSPYSRRPEFSQEELRRALGEYGIAYLHLQELGNPPQGREAARIGHLASYREIFTAHLDSMTGQDGLHRVLALSESDVVCLLCLEKSANHCHRSMVASRLAEMSGKEIVHLKVGVKTAHPAQAAFDF